MQFSYKAYIIAFRNKSSGSNQFKIVRNKWNSWAADPFFFEHNGRLFLFAELYVYSKDKGEIGFCEYKNGSFGKWKTIIEEPYHLSYPNIFEEDDEIYICPESNENESVYFYRAVKFPEIWEKCPPIISGMKCTDTTFLNLEKANYGFTYRIDQEPGELLLFRRDAEGIVFSEKNPITTDIGCARPGGNFLIEKDGIYRVSQDNKAHYCDSIVVSKLNLDWPHYQENPIRKITINDIPVGRSVRACGIHTYNRLGDFETVDLLIYPIRFAEIYFRGKRKIKKILKRFYDKRK